MGFQPLVVMISVLIGFPASGKSTYTERLLDAVTISSDKIREEMYGNEAIQGNPKDVFALVNARAEQAVKDGRDVIIDATNLSVWSRKSYVEIAKKHNISIEAIVFDTPIDVCKARNKIRDRQVPDSVYDKMVPRFQMPTRREGFEKITVVKN